MVASQVIDCLLQQDSWHSVGIWGVWYFDRLPIAATSAVASFIPVGAGLVLEPSTATKTRFAPALIILVVLTASGASSKLPARWRGGFLWLTAGYGFYLPFIAWWDPYEPKWFLVPNLFLIGACALVWRNMVESRLVLAPSF